MPRGMQAKEIVDQALKAPNPIGGGTGGRSADERQSRRCPAQLCLDGNKGSDPRDHRAGTVSDVARGGMMLGDDTGYRNRLIT